jgi:DNA-binding transcriptional regulator YdaS (Cro superfamily)
MNSSFLPQRAFTMKRSEKLQMQSALERSIELAGGLSALTRTLQLKHPQTVNMWRSRRIPAERAVEIELALEGKVMRHELRPDLFIKCDRECAA